MRHPAWVTLCAVLLGGLFMGAKWLEADGSDSGGIMFEPVNIGDFKVTIIEGGALDSTSKQKLECELPNGGVITYLIPEGKMVGKGDVLVRFSDADLKEKISAQRVSVVNAYRDLTNAVKDLAIKGEETLLANRASEDELKFAESDLLKYIEGDYPMSELELNTSKALAEEELKRAEEKLRLTHKLNEKGYATDTQVSAEEFTVRQKQLQIKQYDMRLMVLQKYDKPKQEQKLKATVNTRRVHLKSTFRRSDSLMGSHQSVVRRREGALEEQQLRLERYEEQLTKATIRAPQDGLVIYSASTSSRSSVLIEKGAQLRSGQDIIQLPDMSQMMVEIKIHESRVRQVKPGMEAIVRIDSLPDRQFRGTVKKIAPLPDTRSRYYEPDLKVYNAEVWIENDPDNPLPGDLKPGVSAVAEIIIENLAGVMTVPIQCVATRRGRTHCYVRRGEQVGWVPVDVGLSNDTTVEIKGGLKAGDQVALVPPAEDEGKPATAAKPH